MANVSTLARVSGSSRVGAATTSMVAAEKLIDPFEGVSRSDHCLTHARAVSGKPCWETRGLSADVEQHARARAKGGLCPRPAGSNAARTAMPAESPMTPTMGTRLGRECLRASVSPKCAALSRDLGQCARGHAEQPARAGSVPAQLADVEQQRAAGVGKIRGKNFSARESVNQRPSIVPRTASPRFSLAAMAGLFRSATGVLKPRSRCQS